MKRKYTVTTIIEVEADTLALGQKLARETFEKAGLKALDVKPIKRIRSLRQNASIHLWFEQIEDHCNERGLTVEALYKKPSEIKITKHILKDFFRETAKYMFRKDSTAKLESDELSEVAIVCEKVFAERLDSTIPFPSIDTMVNDYKIPIPNES